MCDEPFLWSKLFSSVISSPSENLFWGRHLILRSYRGSSTGEIEQVTEEDVRIFTIGRASTAGELWARARASFQVGLWGLKEELLIEIVEAWSSRGAT
jgi:hypothetical protein